MNNPIISSILREAIVLDAEEGIFDTRSTAQFVLNGLNDGEFDEAHSKAELDNAQKILIRLAR